jgi:hypothetical protein
MNAFIITHSTFLIVIQPVLFVKAGNVGQVQGIEHYILFVDNDHVSRIPYTTSVNLPFVPSEAISKRTVALV